MTPLRLPKIDATDKPSGSYVRSFLDLSTAHFTKTDNELLEKAATSEDAPNCPIFVHSIDQGYIVILTGDDEDWLYAGRYKLIEAGFSLAFEELASYAKARGYTGLWFDADADKCDAFPTFDWMATDQLEENESVGISATELKPGNTHD